MIRSSINVFPLFRQLTALKREVATSTGGLDDTVETLQADLDTANETIALLEKQVCQIGMGFLCFDLTNFDMDTGLGLEDTDMENFALCDGQDGRPDMKGLFVVGLDPDDPDYDTIGLTGGEKEVTLDIPQIPPHDHIDGDYSKLLMVDGETTVGSIDADPTNTEPNLGSVGTLQEVGGGEAHENRPPYYVAAYIMRYQ